MIYLSQLLGNPVYDAKGENIGRVNDLGIATGEVFPRVTSLAIEGPSRTPFMLSWRKYVDTYNENEVRLKVVKTDPGLRGDTATGGSKPATLETGYVVKVPLFINEGEVLQIDTRTGNYIGRA